MAKDEARLEVVSKYTVRTLRRVFSALAASFLVACSSAVADPPPLPDAPPPTYRQCSTTAELRIVETHTTHSNLKLIRVAISGLDAGAYVALPYSPSAKFESHPVAAIAPVVPAFEVETMDAPPPEPAPRRPGFFDVIGNLVKGAVVGLTNLVLLPVNLPLHMIDSRHDVFPLSWNAGALGEAYPSAPAGGPLFNDSLLAPADYRPRKDAYDAKLAQQRAEVETVDKLVVGAYSPRCTVENGACSFDALTDGSRYEVKISGSDCATREVAGDLPAPASAPVTDESKDATKSLAAWQTSFGTRSPQLVAAASAHDAFAAAKETSATELANTTVACTVETTRGPALKKQALLAARFSFGDFMATGVSVQARKAGEPFAFVVPHVYLQPGGRVKVAIVDTRKDWGAAAVTPYEGKLPLELRHARFAAECRALTPAAAEDLAKRSLERLQLISDLSEPDFALDEKHAEARAAARLKLVDGVRDIEALLGRHNETAKAAQAFADARLKEWTEKVKRQVSPLVEKGTAEIALKEGTLAVTEVKARYMSCEVAGRWTPAKGKGRFSLAAVLKELRFIDPDGKHVQPYFLHPDDPVATKPDGLEVKFDVPTVPGSDKLCGVGVHKNGQALVIRGTM